MDPVQVIYISIVVVPTISTLLIMWFVLYMSRKVKKQKQAFDEKSKQDDQLKESMERVIRSQDQNLEVYREMVREI